MEVLTVYRIMPSKKVWEGWWVPSGDTGKVGNDQEWTDWNGLFVPHSRNRSQHCNISGTTLLLVVLWKYQAGASY